MFEQPRLARPPVVLASPYVPEQEVIRGERLSRLRVLRTQEADALPAKDAQAVHGGGRMTDETDDWYIFVKNPWEREYSCHVICDSKPRASELSAMRHSGRSVTATQDPEGP